jgi:CheY-like chemotaxis protein
MGDDQLMVLVVDDAPANLDVLSGILKDHYKVKAATSGEKALKIAGKSPPPNLILLDVMMPEMDGHETCRRLKENPDTSTIPVIFVTGAENEEEKAKGLSMGAVDYCIKPVNPDKLLEMIKLHIS